MGCGASKSTKVKEVIVTEADDKPVKEPVPLLCTICGEKYEGADSNNSKNGSVVQDGDLVCPACQDKEQHWSPPPEVDLDIDLDEGSKCEVHGKKLVYFCFVHKELCCRECYRMSHSIQTCRVKPIEETVNLKTFNAEVFSCNQKFEDLTERLRSIISQLKDNKEDLKEEVDEIRSELERQAKTISDRLSHIKRTLNRDAETHMGRTMHILNTEITTCDQSMSAVHENQSEFKAVRVSDSPLKRIKHYIKALKEIEENENVLQNKIQMIPTRRLKLQLQFDHSLCKKIGGKVNIEEKFLEQKVRTKPIKDQQHNSEPHYRASIMSDWGSNESLDIPDQGVGVMALPNVPDPHDRKNKRPSETNRQRTVMIPRSPDRPQTLDQW